MRGDSSDGTGARSGPGPEPASSPSGPPNGDKPAEVVAPRNRSGLRRRLRVFLSALLITAAAVLAPLSAIAVWVADEIGVTDRYVATMAPLASDPDVQAAVTDRATDAIMTKVDLDALLSGMAAADRARLTAALGGASGPITRGVRNFVRETVAAFVAGDSFAAVWKQFNREVHTAVTGAISGDNDPAVRLRDNAVVLDLAPVVARVNRQLVERGLAVASRVPPVPTEFTLVKSRDAEQVRAAFRVLRLAGNWLPPLTVVLADAGVLLAVRRRRALVAAALAIAAGVAVFGTGLALFRIVYLEDLSAHANSRAAGAVYDQIVRFLQVNVRTIVVLAIVVALGAWLSGPGRWALRARRMWVLGIAAARAASGLASTGPLGAWVHRCRCALRWGAVLVGAVVLVLWPYPTVLVTCWIGVVTVATLAVIEFLGDRRPPRAAGVTAP